MPDSDTGSLLSAAIENTYRGIMAVALKTCVKGAEKNQILSPDLTGMTTTREDKFHSFLALCNLCLAECTQHMLIQSSVATFH